MADNDDTTSTAGALTLTPSDSTISLGPKVYARNYSYFCSYIYFPRDKSDLGSVPTTCGLVDNLTIPPGYAYTYCYSYHLDEVGPEHPRRSGDDVLHLPPIPAGYCLRWWRTCHYTSVPGVRLPFFRDPDLPPTSPGTSIHKQDRCDCTSYIYHEYYRHRNMPPPAGDVSEQTLYERKWSPRPPEADEGYQQGGVVHADVIEKPCPPPDPPTSTPSSTPSPAGPFALIDRSVNIALLCALVVLFYGIFGSMFWGDLR